MIALIQEGRGARGLPDGLGMLQQSFIVGRDRLELIVRHRRKKWCDGVNLKRFSPKPQAEIEAKRRELGLAPGIPVLGFVGRFSKDKGARAILATRKKLLENNIDHEILLIGSA